MSDHFGKLGIKYISKNIFKIFVTFCLLFPFLYWHQLSQIYTYQHLCFKPIQDRGGAKRPPPISFSPVTSTNVGFGPQNFMTFSFNLFATPVQNFKFIPSPKLLNFNQDHASQKAIFPVKSLWNWGYDNFSHRKATVTKLWSHDHIYNIICITW